MHDKSQTITEIWSEFHAELRAYIVGKTQQEADADDILQDIFVKIIRHIDKVNQARHVRHYIYGMVRNALNDYYRQQRQPSDEAELERLAAEDESSQLNATIAACCVRPFIHQLPAPYRDALLMTEFQEISQKELAENLGISYSGAKSRVQRGKEKLKGLILDCCAYQSDAYGNLREDENPTPPCP